MLNTKQVRALGKEYCGKGADYTDRTLRGKGQEANTRRTVVWRLFDEQKADALAKYLRKHCTNKVTRTTVEFDGEMRTMGGEYVRVIAELA